MGKVRRGAKGRTSLTAGKAFAGYRGMHAKLSLKKQSIQEQALRLLKTMRNQNTTSAVRKAAKERLEGLIAGQGTVIKEARSELPQHKEEKTKRSYSLSLNLIEIRQAELDIIKALFAGAKITSKEVQNLAAKANAKRQERAKIVKEAEAEREAAIRSQQKP